MNLRNRKLLLLPLLLIAGLIIIFTNTDEPPVPTVTWENPEVSPDRPSEKVTANQAITTTSVPTVAEAKADVQDHRHSLDRLYDTAFNDIRLEVSVPPPGTGNIHPLTPEALYLAHIDNARQGDAESQYQVTRALNECLRTPPPEGMSQIRDRVGPALATQVEAAIEFCKPLWELVPHARIREEHQHWFDQALLQEHPVAQSLYWGQHTDAFDQAQVKGFLERALMHNDPETYSLVGSYYAKFEQDRHQAISWHYVNCILGDFCNREIFTEHLESFLSARDIEDAIREGQALIEKIKNKQAIELSDSRL